MKAPLGLASAKPGFLDRVIHAEATTARLPLVTFKKAAARLPEWRFTSAMTGARGILPPVA